MGTATAFVVGSPSYPAWIAIVSLFMSTRRCLLVDVHELMSASIRLRIEAEDQRRSKRLAPKQSSHFAVVAMLRTGTDDASFENDFARAPVIVRAAKPAPKANRITGPKLFAAE